MKQLIKIMAIALLSIGSVDAKGASGGGSRSGGFSSSSRSSSFSRPAVPASKPYVAPAPKPSAVPAPINKPAVPYSKPNTAVAQTSSRPTSNVASARYQESVKSGKVFKSRDAAVNDFKTTKASSYSSKYNSEPSKRPDHIPSNYIGNDGKTYNITYNQQGGGYGYYSGGGPGLGTFMLYDLIQDEVNLNRMMSNQNYYIGPPPQTTVVRHESGWNISTCLIFIITTLVLGGIVWVWVGNQ